MGVNVLHLLGISFEVLAAIVPCDSYVIVAAAPSRISISEILSI